MLGIPGAAGALVAVAALASLVAALLTSPVAAADGRIALVVFVRDGCPHCTDAKAYLARQASAWPDVAVVYRSLDDDPDARAALAQVSRQAGVWPPGVPTFVAGGRVLVGFGNADDSGPPVQALIAAARADREARAGGPASGPLPAPVPTVPFGPLDPERLGLPLFTLALGLVDGFNPCATWVLLFLLSLLVRLRDRRRLALVAGTFVVASGAVYYAFMAAWLGLFLAVGLSAPLRMALALVALAIGAVNTKDFFAWRRGPSLTIPERAKPGLFARLRAVMNADKLPAAMISVAALAVAVNFVELLCTAGLPAIYTALLARQELGGLAYHAYLGLYVLAYIADDATMVAVAVVALSSRKLTEAGGRWLKLLAGLVMIALGALMLLRPDLLA